MYSAAYGTVYYKKTSRSFEIRVEHSTGFGLRSVVILPQCAESDVKQYSLTPQTLEKEDKQESDGRILLHVADAVRLCPYNTRGLPFNFHGGCVADNFGRTLSEINNVCSICSILTCSMPKYKIFNAPPSRVAINTLSASIT